jgi:hypothetical protein
VLPGLVWALLHWALLRDERPGRLLVAGLLWPAFLLLGVAATGRALVRHLRRRTGWAKTERLAEVTP